ncbi:MAG: serine/threonine protein kinase, partial [Myxococcales bacterium]|nr:serine/threonine protein kinase [Myxococcales bacterium]
TREGHVRVLDFGIAKSAFQESKTESGIIKGKLPYMAPEQARGKEVDGRADQFALGIVLWEMLTGQRLFARDDPVLTMTAMFHDPIPKPSSVRPCPEVLERIVMRALKRSPTDRFDSCESFANALRGWMASTEAGSESRLVRRLLAHAIPPQEDEAFYSPDRPQDDEEGPIPSEELHLVGVELTPSGIDARLPELDDAPRPPPPELTPTVGPRRGRGVLAMVGAAVVLVGLAFGVTVLAVRPAAEAPPTVGAASADVEVVGSVPVTIEEPRPSRADEPASAPSEPAPEVEPVRIRFLDVPPGVVIEVDGGALQGSELRVMPSDEVHRVRALVRGREVWRYDGLFRRDGEVRVPPLVLDAPRVERPTMSPRSTKSRGGSSTMRPRLGMEIDLGYP